MRDVHTRNEQVDKAVKRFEFETREKAAGNAPIQPRVITISRQLGSGGRRVALNLASVLGWSLWDREILEVLSSQSHVATQSRMFEALDEKAQGSIDNLVYATLGGMSKHVYFSLLPRAILTVAQNDAIILGRGAHLILPDALRVRIVACFETRVRNLCEFEGLGESESRAALIASDHDREAWLQELVSKLRLKPSDLKARMLHDLVINTDHMSIPDAAAIILEAAARRFDMETVTVSIRLRGAARL